MKKPYIKFMLKLILKFNPKTEIEKKINKKFSKKGFFLYLKSNFIKKLNVIKN